MLQFLTKNPAGPPGRRAVAASLALLAGASLVSGCAGQGSKSDGSTDSNGVVNLSFWNFLTGSDKPTIDKMIATFNDTHPKIHVTSNGLPGDVLSQKLLTAIASGTGPDIMSLNGITVAQYAAKGALQPTDDFYSSTKYMDTSVLVKPAVDVSKVGGKNYGVPLNLSTEMLYWNKDLFAKAGLDHPPTTLDEFTAMADKLTVDANKDGVPEQYAIVMASHDTLPIWQPQLWNFGGGVVSQDGRTATLDAPGTLNGIKYWVNAVRNKKVSPLGAGGADADKMFTSGKAAMELVGPWIAPTAEEAKINFGVTAPFSGPSGLTPLADTVTFGLSAKADAAKKDAAYQFFAFWLGRDNQKVYAEGTGFPSTRTDLSAADLGSNKYPAIFGDPKITSAARVYLAGVPNGGQVNDTVFVPALEKVLNGADIDATFSAANKQAQALIDQGQ
ncbi:ABC transporter substrate-binding protein [Dactylosporangium sp. CA-233914]|uniref:ABC transporter substrate-binding protein n=1 Tax=Dactylosporangium sp. CA-233914 TaxID=3239934 RepID=UPI003D8C0ADE